MPWPFALMPMQTIPLPEGAESGWTWIAVVMAIAFAGYWRHTEVQRTERDKGKDKLIDELRAELKETAREMAAGSAKQLDAAHEQARAHAEERRVFLAVLERYGPPPAAPGTPA